MDDERYNDLCHTIYQKRYPALGCFNDLRPCKEYLSGMPKFVMFQVILQNMAKENAEKRKRPIGTKHSKQKEADSHLIKKLSMRHQQ